MIAYERTADGYRCHRHAVDFGTAESCGGCADDPPPLPDDEPEAPIAPPVGCKTLEQLECDYYQQANEITGYIRKLTGKSKGRKVKDGEAVEQAPALDLHAYNTIVKLVEVRHKIERSAGELTAFRERAARLARREKERREAEQAAH